MTKVFYIVFSVIIVAGVLTAVFLATPSQETNKSINQESKELSSGEIDTSSWQTYRNEEFGFEFRYPAGGRVLGPDRDVVGQASQIWYVDQIKGQDNIQFHVPETKETEEHLFDVENLSHAISAKEIAIKGGRAFYLVDQFGLNAPHPTARLIGPDLLFLVTYNIGDNNEKNFAAAESLLKSIISTFEFVN